MSISGDYPHPVQVNGFTCHNCTDVDYAKKHIDPAHPKAGPYGVDAASDPSLSAFRFDGALKGASAAASTVPTTAGVTAPGQTVNVLV